jgi:hypothetical protein
MEIAKNRKRPKATAAWCMTIAAILDMFAFVLLAKGDSPLRTLIVLGACELMFIVITVILWKQYFEELIDFKINLNKNP